MARKFTTPVTVRPQRRWQMDHHDRREGYAHRLPPAARAWLERFDREAYAVDASRVRTGLHADRLTVAAVERLPARMRRWWGSQAELWPELALAAAVTLLGMGPEAVDSSRRRALYVEQNAANRDVYSLGRVVYLDEQQQEGVS